MPGTRAATAAEAIGTGSGTFHRNSTARLTDQNGGDRTSRKNDYSAGNRASCRGRLFQSPVALRGKAVLAVLPGKSSKPWACTTEAWPLYPGIAVASHSIRSWFIAEWGRTEPELRRANMP
jgi:hypothetical protein